MAVPEFNLFSLSGGFRCKDCLDFVFDIFQAAQAVSTVDCGNGPLGIGPHGQTRNPQIGCLLLDAAGICNGKAAMEYQVHESDIVKRLHRIYPGIPIQQWRKAKFLQVLPGSRMNRKNEGDLL